MVLLAKTPEKREPGGRGRALWEIVMSTAPARDNQGTSKRPGAGEGPQSRTPPSTTGKSQAKAASSVLSALPEDFQDFQDSQGPAALLPAWAE